MRLHHRLRRPERVVGTPACPACPGRRDGHVLLISRQLLDGTVLREASYPTACDVCGALPENVIEVVEVVIEQHDDLAHLSAAAFHLDPR